MELFVTKTTYEKNATDGIEVHKSRQELANVVHENESIGGTVQVFRCVPVDHDVYIDKVSIDLVDK